MEPKPKADFLIEASFEVCNKVGGIYTVITSKSQLMQSYYKDNYLLIGPYFEDKAKIDLEECQAPEIIKRVIDELKDEGIICHFGKWQIEGEPNVLLIDFKGKLSEADGFKGKLWEDYKVDTLGSGYDYIEPMIWSLCIGRFIQKFEEVSGKEKIVSHFHEWLAGIALLYLKSNNCKTKTVFTTHATMLGRCISSSGAPLYSMIKEMDPYQQAKDRGVLDKFTTEKACANACDIFTTVSEITGYEAEHILGRKPEVLVLNGLDINKFPTFEETSVKHRQSRREIRKFLSYYFQPYYKVDLKESLNFFVFGRNEFKNKGLDIFSKALARLNKKLIETDSKKSVFAFYFIPCNAGSIRFEVLDAKNKFIEIQDTIKDEMREITSQIINTFFTGKKESFEELFSKEFILEMRKKVMDLKREGLPPLSTHNIYEEENESILRSFKENGLMNDRHDKVKVILYPIYVTDNDGLLNLPYYDVICGGHLGVYPSYYEPWGYTPLEACALGVPSLTTDLAGFGRYVNSKDVDGGVFVLPRKDVNEEESLNKFVDIMYEYCSFDQLQRVEQKMKAKKVASLADWSELIKNYIKAHNRVFE